MTSTLIMMWSTDWLSENSMMRCLTLILLDYMVDIAIILDIVSRFPMKCGWQYNNTWHKIWWPRALSYSDDLESIQWHNCNLAGKQVLKEISSHFTTYWRNMDSKAWPIKQCAYIYVGSSLRTKPECTDWRTSGWYDAPWVVPSFDNNVRWLYHRVELDTVWKHDILIVDAY